MGHRLEMSLLLVSTTVLLMLSATAAPRLPADISQWAGTPHNTSSREYQHLHQGDGKLAKLARLNKTLEFVRFWDRSTLEPGMAVENYGQVRPLLDKLNAGQPIIAVVFGDSITCRFGGCFHAQGHDDYLRSLGVVVDPIHNGHNQRGSGCTPVPVGWIATFMQQINTTWPHKNHLLINLGMPGNSFRSYGLGDCWEEYLPRHVDLVILEHLPYLEERGATTPGIETERLLHRLFLHLNSNLQGALPTVIMLTAAPSLSPFIQSNDPRYINATACILEPKKCEAQCPSMFADLPPRDVLYTRAEMDTHAVASYYGMASLSVPAMMHALMRDRLPQRRLGLSDCEAFALLYEDNVHPEIYGRLLMSDMIINYLAAAEAYLSDPAAQEKLTAPWLPLRPLAPESHVIYKAHCMYAAPVTSAHGATPGSNNAGGGASGTGTGQAATSAAALHPLPIAKAEGWAFVGVDGESQKHKPGMVATTPGSVLWIDLSATVFQSQAASIAQSAGAPAGQQARHGSAAKGQHVASTGQQWRLHITYLRSYRHMGKGQLSCLESCSCNNVTLNGHHDMHVSIPTIEPLFVNVKKPDGRCILQITVLPETGSGEHKVKIIHVAVGIMVNMSQQLHELAMGTRQRAAKLQRSLQQGF